MPRINQSFRARRQLDVELIRIGEASGLGVGVIRVVALDLVLRAITTGHQLASDVVASYEGRNEPLWKGLIAPNVPPLAGLTPFPTLGVTSSRWTGTLRCHARISSGRGCAQTPKPMVLESCRVDPRLSVDFGEGSAVLLQMIVLLRESCAV